MIGESGHAIKMATSAETLGANTTPLKRSEAMSADIVDSTPARAKSLQNIAIGYLNQRLCGQVHVEGWTAEMYRQCRLAKDEPGSWREQFRCLPDGFLKLKSNGYVWLIAVEVEDSNYMTREKLEAYADLWFTVDC